MLSRENVGYASTCNSVGQTAGYFMGNVLFLALESADFCNKYLREEPRDMGIVTLSGRRHWKQGSDLSDQLSPVFFCSLLCSRLPVLLGSDLLDFNHLSGHHEKGEGGR